jgi:hypothetical protein
LAYDLALAAPDAPNMADAKGLEKYLDTSGRPQKPFEQWLKGLCAQLEQQNSREWEELALVWQLINFFIEGKQILRRRHRGFGWDFIPLPESTTANMREQNKLGFYSRVLQSKWVASRTKINAVAGDDSDHSIEAAKSGDVFYAALEPKIYTEKFRQQEAVAGQVHGTYARYFYYDQNADGGYAERPITEQRDFGDGEDQLECFDCGFVGGGLLPGSESAFGQPPAQEMQSGADTGWANAGPMGAETQPGMPGLSAGIPGDGDANSATCPTCGSPNVELTPAAREQIETVAMDETGQPKVEKYKLGNLKGVSAPYSQIRHEIACSAEESPWMRWKRRLRTEEVKAAYKDLRIPTPDAKQRDPGLAYEDAMRRSIATNAPHTTSPQRGKESYTDFTQWWFSPCMYADYVFPSDLVTVAGETIPAGTKATDIFPDGMYVAMIEGIDAPLQVSNESHKWHWVTAPYHLRLFTGLGIGINDAVEMQRQWNLILSLVFTQIRTASLPGWIYDKDAIAPDDVRKLSQPQVSVPASLRNRPEGTRIEQLVHQMAPGQIPAHIPWYVQQLDANMQTSAGALVNEGVPGMDSRTATGTQQMVAASQQHNAPEFALKGDADVRSAYVLFELAKKHFVEPRYLPLSGKRGKPGGVWLSAADLANGQVRFEAVRDSWMPNTRMDKQEAIKGLLLMFGGVPGLVQAQESMPAFVDEAAEAFGVDIAGDIFEPTAILCRQRLDQIQEMAPQYEPLVEQMTELAVMAPAMMGDASPPVDPMSGMPVDPMTGMPVDPLAQVAEMVIEDLQPPIEIEEPAHLIAVKWWREAFLDDELKEADPLTRACAKAVIKRHIMAAAQEAQIMNEVAMLAQPPIPEEGNGPQQPSKTPKDQRTSNARANMGGPSANPRPSPRPAPQQMGAM